MRKLTNEEIERIANTDFAYELGQESEDVQMNTFTDFHPEYSEWLMEVIEEVTGVEISDLTDYDELTAWQEQIAEQVFDLKL